MQSLTNVEALRGRIECRNLGAFLVPIQLTTPLHLYNNLYGEYVTTNWASRLYAIATLAALC